jgi:hypothetical protein
MILASEYCIILATLAAITCLGAIATLATFDRFFPDEGTLGFEAGDLIVCVFWIGGSMGGLAWLKQWVNNPSFNTGEFGRESDSSNVADGSRLFDGRCYVVYRCCQGRRDRKVDGSLVDCHYRR